MDLSALINRTVAEVIKVITADPLAWLAGGARADLVALSANPAVRSTAFIAEIVAVFLSVLFIGIIAISTARRKALLFPNRPESTGGESSARPPGGRGPLHAQWSAVVAHLDSTRESDWKIAVIEADKFMDDALRGAGFPGDSFGDRLTNIAPESLVSLDGVWWAHKIRNRLAHETDYFLRYTEAKQAIGYFQEALEELRLI
jgi:hypothetical protein